MNKRYRCVPAWKRHVEYEEEQQQEAKEQALFVFLGETFRGPGGQGCRMRGSNESFQDQHIACETHVKFMQHVAATSNVHPHPLVITYDTQFDDYIRSWYGPGADIHIIPGPSLGMAALYDMVGNMMEDLPEYKYVMFIRADLALKPYMWEVFRPQQWDRVMFSFLTWIVWCMYGDCPRVADMLMFVPAKYIGAVIKNGNAKYLTHEACLKCNEDGVPYGFMIETLHDSDSAKDWNPMYRVVNRSISSEWASDGHYFDVNDRVVKQYDRTHPPIGIQTVHSIRSHE